MASEALRNDRVPIIVIEGRNAVSEETGMPLKFRMQLIADERYESAYAFDVNNDGTLDIASGAHWYEGPDFVKKHAVGEVKAFSEYYDDFSTIPMDVNGDGQPELVTGKRYRAHNDNDPGSFDDYGIYYFKWNGESFTKNPIIFGKIRETKGLGIFSHVVDLNGDGRLDILAPGKDGLAIVWSVQEIDRTPVKR
jgi:hypothetical protein